MTLCSLKALKRRLVTALDGDLGLIRAVYLDEDWKIRRIAVHTDTPQPPDSCVMIPTMAFDYCGNESGRLLIGLAKKQAYADLTTAAAQDTLTVDDRVHRSSATLLNHLFGGLDDSVWLMSDMLFDPISWTIEQLIVGQDRFWFPKQIALGTDRILEANWRSGTLLVNMNQADFDKAPAYSRTTSL